MSGGKDCGIHGDEDQRKSCLRLLAVLLGLALLTGFVILIVFLILRPTHPRFVLKDATLRQFATSNSSSSSPYGGVGGGGARLTAIVQATVASRNPNDRVGILYTRLDAYATYRFQQVTFAASLATPVYQGHGDIDVWSPVLSSGGGAGVPFAPVLAAALAQDLQAGYLALQVRIDGRLRWKVGTWFSGHYHVFVRCPAIFVARGGSGVLGANGFRFAAPTVCRVDI